MEEEASVEAVPEVKAEAGLDVKSEAADAENNNAPEVDEVTRLVLHKYSAVS